MAEDLFQRQRVWVPDLRKKPSGEAEAMARTVGTLLLSVGVLNFLVRHDPDSKTMKSVLTANLVLQLLILPVDPLAYLSGVYPIVDSFLPNTVLHIVLASGFVYYLRQLAPEALEAA